MMNCTCETSTEWISAWLDGALTPLEERMLMAHLEQCPNCAILFEQFTALNAAFSELEELPAPEGFTQGVMERVRAQEAPAPVQPKVVPLFRRPAVRALVSVAACAVLCVGLTRIAGHSSMMDATTPETAMESSVMTLTTTPETAAPESAPAQPAPESVSGAIQEPRAPAFQNHASIECEEEKPDIVIDVYPIPLPLPEGSEAILGNDTEWYTDETGGTCCDLTEEQAKQLQALAEEQNMEVQLIFHSDSGVWTLRLPE